jgi:hypothetical protein
MRENSLVVENLMSTFLGDTVLFCPRNELPPNET